MRSLFVMDPLERIHVRGDSTYTLMVELAERGDPCWYVVSDALYAQNGQARAAAVPVSASRTAPYFTTGEPEDRALGDFDVVWMRKDPPFDMSYVLATYLLDMAPPHTLVVNDPVGLKLFNEKLWAMRFAQFHPPTLLTCDPARIRDHVRSLPGRAVLKPWDGNGGRGVLVTRGDDRNLNSMIELMTGEGKTYVLVQPYLEKVDEGDKRIVLFEGDPVGAMLRVPAASDFRGNMHVGATVEATELTEREVEICDALRPELRRWGQVFVGIDVIDGYLTEINVTSPTGLRELHRLNGVRLEVDLVDRVTRLADARREEAR
jgi:glutathione synthase